jgi:hypothetical protein
MNTDPRLYGNGYDPNVMKDVKNLTEQLEKATSEDEALRLRLQRLYRGMELNAGYTGRAYGAYFPY